jgi:hypothetical protein
MKQITRLLLSSGLAILALSACTKEIPYEEAPKLKVNSKSAFDTDADYLMSSSMLKASRSSEDALPYSMGANQRVRFEWSETSLRVLEMEKDQRFRGNETNNKLVLEIPVDYVEYECAKDKFGECTNTEAEVGEKRDYKGKTQFKFKLEAAKSARLEILPILLDNEISDKPCYSEVSARVVDLKLESDAFNMAIERTFKVDINCTDLRELGDSTVTAVFHYSFVKTASVLSKGFKTVQYPNVDEDSFGFFQTESQVLDQDNNANQSGERAIMNHWNPDRSEITYLLSDEFKKPEHAKIRQLTEQVVGSLNDGLSQAGAKFKINLKDAEGKSAGDIRNSMIVLVEDPVASSIIGYGPQTEDPVTGEIVSARTVMFLGTIKKFIKFTYDDILREKKAAKLAALRQPQPPPSDDPNADDNGGLILEDALKARMAQSLFKAESMKDIATYKKPEVSVGSGATNVVEAAKIKQIEKELRTSRKHRNMDYEGGAQAHLKYLKEAKNCAYGLNADLASESISPRLAARFPDDAKPWEQLSESEKQAAIDIILPEIWVPTLIHEMGHNLGLRHNFKGSEDPKNFYTPAELEALKIDHQIPFSTVMEYGDDLKALPVLGKYDIAALRFAYAQKVELADGSVVPVVETIEKTLKVESEKAGREVSLKEYGYCTDEHTGINAGCRRFDLGTTLTEIVEHEILTYQAAYERRNKRAGRADFSLIGDIAYGQRIKAVFQGLRIMQESYESIKTRFGIPDEHPIWNTNAFLKDLKTASTKSADFLMSVVATPNLTCAIVDISNPGVLVDAVQLDDLDASQISCFDIDLADFGLPNLAIVGQYGKLFNSRKDPNSSNSYADQIDVRGYWLDKMIATRMLYNRDLGISTLDRETDNFTDRPDLAPKVAALTEAMLLNKVTGEQDLELVTGDVLRMDLPVNSKSQIEKPLFSILARILGIPNEKVAFNQVLLDIVAKSMVNRTHELAGNAFMDTLRVGRTHLGDDKWSADHKFIDISDVRFMASSKNKLARTAMAQHETSVHLEQVEKRDIKDEAGNVVKTGRKRLQELRDILKARGPKPQNMTKDEKHVWELGEETITDYLVGNLEKPDFFKELLSILPAASKN